MTNKKPVSVANMFAAPGQAQQVLQLKDRVAELEVEIKHLRKSDNNPELEARIRELTAQLVERSGVHEIDVDLIKPDPNQPRTIFPSAVIQARAKSLREDKQQTPIILIPREGWYEIFDGELRWRSAHLAGLTALKAVFFQEKVQPKEIFDKQLTTSLQSEKLHGLDLANALIQLIIYKYPQMQESVNDIPNILNATIQRLKRAHQAQKFEEIRIAEQKDQQQWLANLNLEQDAENILEVLLGKQLNPASINTNIFPLLKLPQDLQQVIREQGLESTKAKELAKLSAAILNVDEDAASRIRAAAAYQVIEEARSHSETRELVKTLINKHVKAQPSPLNPQLKKVRHQIQSIKFDGITGTDEIKELKKMLRNKLKELEVASNRG